MLKNIFLQITLKYHVILLLLSCALATQAAEPLIYMRPNETPMFTELYQRYGLLNPPALHVYDSSIYLGQPGEKGSLLIPSSEAFFSDVEKTLRAFHTRIGNQELFTNPKETNYVFCPSNGSLQTIFGLVYAIATSEPKKQFLFVEKIPFYSFHEHALTYRPYPNVRFQAFKDASEVKPKPNETLVEFVTSPNNPDGKFRKPYTKAKIIIADFVFSSPSYGSDGNGYIKENISWVSQAKKQGKHVFAFNSVSKALGKPGHRLGYMWFPVNDAYGAMIFRNFFSYTWKLTVGSSTPGIAEALNLISALLALPDAGQALRTDAYNTIVKRHDMVKTELLKRYPKTEVTSIPGSPTLFAKLKGASDSKTGTEIIYQDLNVAVDNGSSMGATNQFIRINLCGDSEDLAEFLNRLAQSKKYNAHELLITSANHCSKVILRSSDMKNYVVNPNDCQIDVDARDGDVEITLTPFINYTRSNLITINKIDNTEHAVVVKSAKFSQVLKEKDEKLTTKWTQTFFLNGQWQVIKE